MVYGPRVGRNVHLPQQDANRQIQIINCSKTSILFSALPVSSPCLADISHKSEIICDLNKYLLHKFDEKTGLIAVPTPAVEGECLVKRIVPDVMLLTVTSNSAPGYEIGTSVDMVIPGKGKAIAPAGLILATPGGTYGKATSSVTFSINDGIEVGGGTTDS